VQGVASRRGQACMASGERGSWRLSAGTRGRRQAGQLAGGSWHAGDHWCAGWPVSKARHGSGGQG
jgi:hypothetical protein